MTTIFKYGKTTESSASSESLFNDLKNRAFQHKTLPFYQNRRFYQNTYKIS